MSQTPPLDRTGAIAIIGMGLRFPGASSIEEFWENLRNGVESVSFFTDAQLLEAGYPPAVLADPNFVKAMPSPEQIDHFDAAFFGFKPREAEAMDPQIRIFLECSWWALEDAGYDPDRYAGRIGVFAGNGMPNYFMFHLLPLMNSGDSGFGSLFSLVCYNDKDALATVVSHKLNLRGPSMSVQTFCSTSLVATHLACQSLLSGESDMALAGGSSIGTSRIGGYMFEEGGIHSPDGHNRAYDAKGRGTVFGNGTGVVLLKRLEDALADRDSIHAVIRGSAINNDGAQKAGYTAPSVEGQAEAIMAALRKAGVDPATIGYVETHGTATDIGDPIEVRAMTKAFQTYTDRKQYCPIGTVKTNFGHLDRAAGVAGLIKAALVVERGEIPPSLHYETPNPKIDFENSPFYVNAHLSPFPATGGQRRAGVNSLGIGGTNAHAVLEEAPRRKAGSPSRPAQLLLLSARSETALSAVAQQLHKFLSQRSGVNLADVAYTMSAGRRALSHRLAIVGRDVPEVLTALESRTGPRVLTGAPKAAARPVVFLFPGQGAQYVGMARGLYDVEATFRADVDRLSDRLQTITGWDLRSVLYPADEQRAAAEARLRETEVTQPALFVIELALARLWMRWGLRPSGMLGHSVGEYVAACIAGVFSEEDALALIAARGALMQSLPAGAMLAVPLAETDALRYLVDGASLAAINGPQSCVLSGTHEAIVQVEAALEKEGLAGRRLATNHAFHSAMMDPILDEFRKRVSAAPRSAPQIPYVSNLTGVWITTREATNPDYWVQHLRQGVRFAAGMATLLDDPDRVPLEVGPGRTLTQLTRQQPALLTRSVPCQSLRTANDTQHDFENLATAAGQLWTQGVDLDWTAFWQGETRNRVALPTYPFERQRYWVERQGRTETAPARSSAATARPDLQDWFYVPTWKRASMPKPFESEGMAKGLGWLVLVDESPFSTTVVRQLQAAGERVMAVGIGDGFAQLHEAYYRVSPSQREDWDALLTRLQEQGGLPSRIVSFWGLVSEQTPASSLETLVSSQECGFFALLALTQALGARALTHPIHLSVVTNRLHNVTGGEALAPQRATALGPCRVIPQEYPDLTSVGIDIAIPEAGSQDERQLVSLLLTECAAPSAEHLVAYRGGYRWSQAYERMRLDDVRREQLRLRDGGVYLVTGGMGGIGLALADYLAAEHRASLVLVQRTPLPAEEFWTEWLETHTEDDRTSRRIRKLQDLRAKGAQVWEAAADVTDLSQMRAVVSEARARFGAIHGVLHAAGLAGDGVMQLKDPAVARRVLAPKLDGTLVLEQVFADQPLDFFALFSSIAAVTGGFGQVDYCGANSFLDVFANARDGRAPWPVIGINWDAWDEVGMAVETVSRGAAGSRSALVGEPIEHPYFDRRRTAEGEEEYLGIVTPARMWFLNEHRLLGQPTLSSTGYLEVAASVFKDRVPAGTPFELRELFFLTPFSVPVDGERELSLLLTHHGDDATFVIRSRSHANEAWQDHCTGRLAAAPGATPRSLDLAAFEAACPEEDPVYRPEEWKTQIIPVAGHLSLGPRWDNLQRFWRGKDREVAIHELAAGLHDDVLTTTIHPGLVDFTAVMPLHMKGSNVPFSFDRVRIFRPLTPSLRAYVVNHDDTTVGSQTMVFDALLTDPDGTPLVEMDHLTLRRIDRPRIEATAKDAPASALGTAESVGHASTESAAPNRLPDAADAAMNLWLSMSAPGLFSNFEVQSGLRTAPERGQVEIEVVAAGLNFKDVLRALGMIPAEAAGDVSGGFGPECAGRVVAVGPGVTHLQPGDEVMAIAPRSIARYTVTLASLAVPIPRGLSFEQAATIPLVFLTAYHALVNQARLKRGERVLVHAAAGGVGLAALQIARHIGAEIFATASAPKRDFLRAVGLPAVFDSRSLSFVEDVKAATDGEGVDVVLNSLSGDFIPASIGLLRPYGRFIEIGARDIYQNTAIGLRPFANNLTFSAIDLGPLCFQQPEFVREMFLAIADHFTTGAYRALPLEAISISEADRAFERMASGTHVGKIVLQLTESQRGAALGASQGRGSRIGLAAQRNSAELIAPHEGVDAFRRILGHRHTQVLVSPKNLLALVEGRPVDRASAMDVAMPVHVRVQHPRPELATPFVMPRSDAERTIAEIWQDLLGITEVGVHDSFFELGGDSLIGVQALSRVKKAFGVQLTASILYEGPTVETLARLVTGGDEVGAGVGAGAGAEQARSRAERRRERQQRRQDGA
jgi:acyl transferase domain-containing protein/D-arabinose 1-dehydrogenase-like Zn-dependent alcohol dehydrogenase